MPDANDPRTEATNSYAGRTVRPPNIVDHPLMRCTLKKLVNRILTHKQRLELFHDKGMPYCIIQQELDVIDTLEEVLEAKQKFLYRCMGINLR